MGSAWDNLTQVFETARQRRQDTTVGERLVSGLKQNFFGGDDTKTTEFDFGDSAWGSVLEKYKTPDARAPVGGQSGGPVSEERIVDGLVQRGVPAHVAKAFAWNMQDESGLNPGINEISPLVKGSRGGFGLYQLTGPRRRQYEQFAAERGVDVADVDAQLDFLVHELQTTESRAADAIYSAGTTGEAASAIVNKFLRPHETHRKRRSSNYLNRDAGSYTPVNETLIKSWNDLL